MVYVDTSALVAIFTHEVKSPFVRRWYEACNDELISATWCVTEFASALGIKQRTGQINNEQAAQSWQSFERFCAGDLKLLPIEPANFYHAATLNLDADSGLRAGDAVHLAAALNAKAKSVLTLDDVLARNAKRLKLKAIIF